MAVVIDDAVAVVVDVVTVTGVVAVAIIVASFSLKVLITKMFFSL